MGVVGVGVVAARWIEGGQVGGSAASCFGDLLMAWFWQGHLHCRLPREFHFGEIMQLVEIKPRTHF